MQIGMTTQLVHVVLASCTFLHAAAGAVSQLGIGQASERAYTQNSLCRQNNCINPLFPGLSDLQRLEAVTWQCATQSMVKDSMNFCKDAVPYDPALPSPSKAKTVAELVKTQDDAAMTMFVYHLNGMGYDAWDYRDPTQSDSDCVRSVWKMVCFTYFPRANAGCQQGQPSLYQRPCRSSCTNYIAQCGIECCDESVQCAFSHTRTAANGSVEMLQTGYVDADGPSAMCTGSARHTMTSPLLLILAIFGIHCAFDNFGESRPHSPVSAVGHRTRLWRHLPVLALLAGLTLCLQGCDSDVPLHESGNWRLKKDYLSMFSFLPPGGNPKDAVLNSCAAKDTPSTLQCSGRGYCKGFSPGAIVGGQDSLAFCSCDQGWADPECNTPRKSQRVAFFISLLFGMFGADYFYLGFPLWGLAKLLTLGGCGFWWLIDIVRIAAGPVYAYNFRTANDLPHVVAILILVFIFLFLGFFVAIQTYFMYRKKKRDDIAFLEHSEENAAFHKTKTHLASLYGTTPAMARANTGAPFGGTHCPEPARRAGGPRTWYSL